MIVSVYLEGTLEESGQSVSLPLSSCALLLVVHYAGPAAFRLVFVQRSCPNSTRSSDCVTIPRAGLTSVQHDFITAQSEPSLVRNVVLPAAMDSAASMVRSGLCVVIRHIIKVADSECPAQGFKSLLGFRQGSLRMCAEVSGWTKLCEVELPNSVAQLIHHVTNKRSCTDREEPCVELPSDLLKLESHLLKPPKVHNDDRWRRQELSKLKDDAADPLKLAQMLQDCSNQGSNLTLLRKTELPHGCKMFTAEKSVMTAGDSLDDIPLKGASSPGTKERLLDEMIQSLTYLDIHLVHLYSEGVEMTIADICLFTYMYFLLEALRFDPAGLGEHLPRVLQWLRHMTSLPRLESACLMCGLNFVALKDALATDSVETCVHDSDPKGVTPGHGAGGSEENGPKLSKLGEPATAVANGTKRRQKGFRFRFTKSAEELTEDEMELSRRCRTKYRAIQPDVVEALKQMKTRSIEPALGIHPRGTQVGLDWDTFPACVHPREGQVPAKRVERKCHQLENLVTAVLAVAQPGDVIVDFCSGGGHLGIAIAYLLPQCKVYLVENKEESLARAQSRMADLASDNIVLFQCNMDYFVGKFDIGVCLHACGSATDMVLHQCLQNKAAFVICPCCYGSIQRTHLLTYPRSRLFQENNVSYQEFVTMGHAADQTEFNIALEQQGRQCMNLVDTDRAHLAMEAGYTVTLTSLQPLTCSPKNNLLIGQIHPAAV